MVVGFTNTDDRSLEEMSYKYGGSGLGGGHERQWRQTERVQVT